MSLPERIKTILATDCGSTTTKAILIELVKNPETGEEEYRQTIRGEAPTTVEAPFEDVTRGVLNSVMEIEELRNRKFIEQDKNGEDKILRPSTEKEGCDIYISTSSAGGGLQMMVAGVVKQMSAESAARAAYSAGAIVMDTLASNDGRLPHQKIERIRKLRPDMLLMSGGTDDAKLKHVVEMAELIRAARPKARLGHGYNLPVIYAGSKLMVPEIQHTLGDIVSLKIVDNLRPVLERENTRPARDAVHELFMEHVMQQAPGYSKLMTWTDAPIMPTPGAVGDIMQLISKQHTINVVGVDIGGATTDIFSVFRVENPEEKTGYQWVFNRTVSANLGMSYSISNVLAEAGLDNIMRWVPFELPEIELRNRIANKMIRPTTIPQTREELQVEQAIAREALRLAFVQHKAFAVSLKGVQQERTISDTFAQSASGESLVKMLELDLIVGSGGVLSHAPRRSQSMHMAIDSFLPEGVTKMGVDSIFMMPHLGVLASVPHPDAKRAAVEVFEKDCMVWLGTCIAPVGNTKDGKDCVTVKGTTSKGRTIDITQPFGEMKLYPLELGESAKVTVMPVRGFDVGAGNGKTMETELTGGVVGLVVDTRGRPFQFEKTTTERLAKLKKWAFDD
ncbi:MAG: glutamate mutase L [bacterium]|nr:glutamate mutase L [bacterium]